jgi:hypothetical protein
MRRLLVLLFTAVCLGQAQPLRQQSSSSIAVSGPKGGETIEIRNVSYDVTSTAIPGRPREQRLVLRKTVRSQHMVDDIGVEASTMLEAWVFPGDLTHKPLYSLTVPGTDGKVVDTSLFVVSRGLEEVEWWSVYKLGNAEHLFDTYLPLSGFSISRENVVQRYAGLEVPADDTKDARLKRPEVVAVLTYASDERVIREVLIACDDPRTARLLRSYSDTQRTVVVQGEPPRLTLKVTFSQNYPSIPDPKTLLIPIVNDDLDVQHAQAPPRVRVSAWKR